MPSIINSDDGVVSGTSGLKTTGGNDGLLNIQSNGTNVVELSSGVVAVKGTSSSGAAVRVYEDTDNGTNYVGLQAPASVASNVTFTLPSADGTSGQALVTNGSGALSFGSAGFSGATINAPSASALTLTSASTQYQRVQSTSTTNNIVNLPDATTLATEGSFPFVIENRSLLNQSINIRNNGGNVIGTVSTGGVATCSLVDNATSNGTWSIGGVSSQQIITGNLSSVTNTTLTAGTATTSTKVLGLTATKFIVFYQTRSSFTITIRVLVGDISGSTITYGAEQTATYSTAVQYTTDVAAVIECVRLSDSSFVMYYGQYARDACSSQYNSALGIRTCTVSGTTVTFGTESSLSMPSGANYGNNKPMQSVIYNPSIIRMSDTKFAVFYNTGVANTSDNYPTHYSGSLTCNIITVSGTTQTIGTKVDLGTSTYTQVLGAVCYDTDKLLVVYGQGTAGSTLGRAKLVVVTVSGTVPTWATPVNIQSADTVCQTGTTPPKLAFAISTSKCFVTYVDTTNKAAVVNIATTTPSVDLSGSVGGILTLRTAQLISTVLLGGTTYTYFDASGYYQLSGNAVDSAQTSSISSLPASGSTSLVTCNGANAGEQLTTVLATGGIN